MLTANISIQIDDFSLDDTKKLNDAIEKAIKQFPRRRITINFSETFGEPLPVKPDEKA